MKPNAEHRSGPVKAPASDTIDSESDPRLASVIARMKAQAREQNAKSGWRLAGWSMVGVATGIWAWVVQDSMDREAPAACAAGFLVFFVGWYLHENLSPKNDSPKCPRCGHAWEEEGFLFPTWKHCPGCGLRMQEHSPTHGIIDES